MTNESTDILRIFNSAFNDLAKNPSVDLYPADLEEDSARLNDDIIYNHINNGVYRCGFAKTQAAYEDAVTGLFNALDQMEELLSKQRYLAGDGKRFCWIDLRLFMTLVRFDEVYVVYFKTNKKLIREYPNLFNYTKDVYQIAGVGSAISMSQIKTHYFSSHVALNGLSIVPAGMEIDYTASHDRDRF